MTDYGLNRFSDLVMVSGKGAKQQAANLVRNLQAEDALMPQIEAAKWVAGRRWNLVTHGGIEIKLPADDIGLALRRLAIAQEEKGILEKSLEHIDLRKTDRIIVQSAPGKVQKYRVENFTKAGYSNGNDI